MHFGRLFGFIAAGAVFGAACGGNSKRSGREPGAEDGGAFGGEGPSGARSGRPRGGTAGTHAGGSGQGAMPDPSAGAGGDDVSEGGAAGEPSSAAGGGGSGQAGAPSEGGEAGAAGAPGPVNPRLVIIEPGGPLEHVAIETASEDGSVLVGRLTRALPLGNGSNAYERNPVSWTSARGLVELGSVSDLPGSPPHTIQSIASSSDGTVVTGVYNKTDVATGNSVYGGLFRWTAADGLVSIPTPAGVLDGRIEHLSADGSTTIGAVSGQNFGELEQTFLQFRWTVSDGFSLLSETPGWPADSFDAPIGAVSADGKVLLVRGHRLQRWTEAGGLQSLGSIPAEQHCSADLMTADGATVFGHCSDGTADYLFRWTEETGMVALGSCPAPCSTPELLSADGSTMLGFVTVPTGSAIEPPWPGSRIYRWTADTGLSVLAAPAATPALAQFFAAGTSADGSVVFGEFQRDAGTTNRTVRQAGSRVFRWSAGTGMVSLRVLPGHDLGRVHAGSADGDVLAGYSAVAGSELATARAVVWDGAELLAIDTALEAAGIELNGYHLNSALRVWSTPNGIQVWGLARSPDRDERSFVAWLPRAQ